MKREGARECLTTGKPAQNTRLAIHPVIDLVDDNTNTFRGKSGVTWILVYDPLKLLVALGTRRRFCAFWACWLGIHCAHRRRQLRQCCVQYRIFPCQLVSRSLQVCFGLLKIVWIVHADIADQCRFNS